MLPASTKDRILDAAEILFASEGYHCTSLRALTREAGVNLAAVSYHFGSKEALVEALLERRLHPLNRERERRLDQVLENARNAGTLPDVGEILRAFLEPTLSFRESGRGPRHFVTFIGRILIEPDDILRRLFLQRIRPLFGRFYLAMRSALPQVSAQQVFMRLQLTLGMVSHAMCSIERFSGKAPEFPLPEGVTPVASGQELCELIVAFARPGLERP